MIAAIRRRDRRSGESDHQEAQLLASLVRDCVTAGIGRHACVVHLSRLATDRVRPHHMRLARAALEPLAQADRARLFTLPNHDLVAIWRGPAETALETSRAAILHLFTEDATVAGGEVAELWEELDLPDAAARLLSLAEQPTARALVPKPEPETLPLDPVGLAALEAGLAHADVARFARRRQICAFMPNGHFFPRWEKRYLSVDELAESLVPGHAPRAEPWLFRRLTRTLDRRMLALLAAPGELAEAGPFAINLNVSSILAPEFLRFDTALPQNLRGRVIIDLLAADVLSDPAAFMFARDFAKSRGYRLVLRGVSAELLPVFSLDRIGLDYLQLRWSEQVAAIGDRELVADAGRIILSHVDTHHAVAWGRVHGIGLFQGRMAVASRPGLTHDH